MTGASSEHAREVMLLAMTAALFLLLVVASIVALLVVA